MTATVARQGPGSLGGAAKTGPLPYDTEYVANYVVTGR